MLTTIKERLGRDEHEEGFTLIELMVVVLIIAILLAIAIPTFLGARNSANARAMQSNIRNALTSEQTYFTNNQSFTDIIADMTAVEPNLGWATLYPTTKGGSTVDILAYSTSLTAPDLASDTGENGILIQGYGQDGNCYAIFQANSAVSTVAAGTYYSAFKGQCATPATLPSNVPAAGSKATTNITATGWATATWSASW